MEDEVDAAKTQLFEAIAESDDTLLEKYLEGEELTTEEAFEGIRKGIADGVIIPVLAASAERIIGVDRLLDVIAGSAPSPVDRSRWMTQEGEEVPCDPDGPFAAYVFKTYQDPYAGRLSVLRVVSGRCRSDEALTNPRTDSSERLGGISHLVGKEREHVDEAVAGDVIAVAKLRDTYTFDTLSKPEKPMVFEPVELPEPTSAFAVGAKARGEEEKVFDAIRRVTDEDPSLKLERSEATGEDILAGLAQMHVELALERITALRGRGRGAGAEGPVHGDDHGPAPRPRAATRSRPAGAASSATPGSRSPRSRAATGFEFENAIVGGVDPAPVHPGRREGHRRGDAPGLHRRLPRRRREGAGSTTAPSTPSTPPRWPSRSRARWRSRAPSSRPTPFSWSPT